MAYIGNKPANKAVVASDLDPAVITGQTALAVAPADTDEFLISDAGTLKRLDASLIGGGKIGQVVQTVKTDIFTSTTASLTDVTGFSVAITPSATSSKVLVMVQCTIGVTNGYKLYTSLLRGSSEIYRGDASGNTVRRSSGGKANANDDARNFNNIFLDSPSTTSATTYKIQAYPESGGTLYFNATRNGVETDNAVDMRTASSITVMEVLA